MTSCFLICFCLDPTWTRPICCQEITTLTACPAHTASIVLNDLPGSELDKSRRWDDLPKTTNTSLKWTFRHTVFLQHLLSISLQWKLVELTKQCDVNISLLNTKRKHLMVSHVLGFKIRSTHLRVGRMNKT